MLVVDHDAKFKSAVFHAFVENMGLCLIVGSANHKNTNAKVRACANARKVDWDKQLPLAEFAIMVLTMCRGGLDPRRRHWDASDTVLRCTSPP